MSWEKDAGGTLPHGEGRRRAIRWLAEQGLHSGPAIEEAALRFDLDPQQEEFLLRHFRQADGEPPPV